MEFRSEELFANIAAYLGLGIVILAGWMVYAVGLLVGGVHRESPSRFWDEMSTPVIAGILWIAIASAAFVVLVF